MSPNNQIQREKELVAAWLNYRMDNWLRSATYVSMDDGCSDRVLPSDCLSRQSIERHASSCLKELASVAPEIDWYQPVAEISHDGHVTITVR